eukprot:10312270-Karenia_brevis.AAC.1
MPASQSGAQLPIGKPVGDIIPMAAQPMATDAKNVRMRHFKDHYKCQKRQQRIRFDGHQGTPEDG